MVEVEKSGDSLNIQVDLDNDVKLAWFCSKHGRFELPLGKKKCPECGVKMIRTSRYAWALVDALRIELEWRGFEYLLVEEVPLETKWDFVYHIDCYVSIAGSDVGFLVDVEPAKKDGRYETKCKVATELQEHGLFYKPVTRAQCQEENVSEAAERLVYELIALWCSVRFPDPDDDEEIECNEELPEE
jgi:hypothetical protein